jgi:hypothetical protein
MTGRWLGVVVGEWSQLGVVDYALDFAAVDAQLAGYGALAVACNVPGPYRLLHRWCTGSHGWCIVLRRGCCLALITCRSGGLCGVWLGSDERHEEFEGSGQGQRGPGADQHPDWAVVQAVGQVLADGGGDAGAQAPARQGWYGPVAPLASRMSMLAARMSPSTVKGRSRAVRPVSPWVVTSS